MNRSRPVIGVVLTLFVVIGAPMAYYVWSVLSDLLAGQFDARSVLIGTGVFFLLVVWLRELHRYLRRI